MHPVGIIGGMGPYAGAQYLESFLQECSCALAAQGRAVNDQGFPPHYVFQQPVPDRTSALFGTGETYDAVLQSLSRQLRGMQTLGVKAAAMACNTAHAWYDDLREAHGGIEIVHIGDTAARHLASQGIADVCLMATAGTVRSGIYLQALERQGIACHCPDRDELAQLMSGIYDGVKAGDLGHGRRCFAAVVDRMLRRTGVPAFLMACTEIPLALGVSDVEAHCALYDPARLSARRLAGIALQP